MSRQRKVKCKLEKYKIASSLKICTIIKWRKANDSAYGEEGISDYNDFISVIYSTTVLVLNLLDSHSK